MGWGDGGLNGVAIMQDEVRDAREDGGLPGWLHCGIYGKLARLGLSWGMWKYAKKEGSKR